MAERLKKKRVVSMETSQREFELVITIVNRGFADEVMDAAKAAGATGGTVLYARERAFMRRSSFSALPYSRKKEVVLILTKHETRNAIMKAICKGAGLTTEGHGLSFSLPVDDVMGIVHMNRED